MSKRGQPRRLVASLPLVAPSFVLRHTHLIYYLAQSRIALVARRSLLAIRPILLENHQKVCPVGSMAEAVGLAIGVVSLASMFTTCLECFEYVEVAKNFNDDFGKCVLRLDVAKLRLSQWGESLGLTEVGEREIQSSMSEPELKTAMRLVQDIVNSFDRAEEYSRKYKPDLASVDTASSAFSSARGPSTLSDLTKAEAQVHSTVKELTLKRQPTASLKRKTSWALYEKRRFNNLIDNINTSVADLMDIVPKEKQASICSRDMDRIKDIEQLKILQSVSDEDDKVLRDAISGRMKSTDLRSFSNFEADDKAKYHLGDKNYGVEAKSYNLNATNFRAKGSSEVFIGNENR